MPEDWKPHERDEFFKGYWDAKNGEPFSAHQSLPWIDGFRIHVNDVFTARTRPEDVFKNAGNLT